MPTYDYRCPINGEVIEVRHPMDEQLSTWGELCQAADREVGDTPPDAPVERLMSAASVVGSSRAEPEQPSCCSPGGMCGCG